MLAAGPRVPNPIPVSHLGRTANRFRQADRPRHPDNLKFKIEWDHVPDDLEVVDVTVGCKEGKPR